MLLGSLQFHAAAGTQTLAARDRVASRSSLAARQRHAQAPVARGCRAGDRAPDKPTPWPAVTTQQALRLEKLSASPDGTPEKFFNAARGGGRELKMLLSARQDALHSRVSTRAFLLADELIANSFRRRGARSGALGCRGHSSRGGSDDGRRRSRHENKAGSGEGAVRLRHPAVAFAQKTAAETNFHATLHRKITGGMPPPALARGRPPPRRRRQTVEEILGLMAKRSLAHYFSPLEAVPIAAPADGATFEHLVKLTEHEMGAITEMEARQTLRLISRVRAHRYGDTQLPLSIFALSRPSAASLNVELV